MSNEIDDFRLLFEQAPMGYQSLDTEGKFIEVNQKWCETLGYNRSEVIGKWFGDFLSPDYKDVFRKNFQIFIEQGHIHSEFEMIHKNGNALFIAFEGKIGNDAEGHFKQTHCILEDITERKVADQKIRNLMAKHKIIVDTVPDIIMEVDTNKIYTWANRAGYEFFGDDVIGKEASYYFEGDQDVYDIIEPLFQGDEKIIYLESFQRRKDGEIRFLAWWCKVYKDPEGNAVGAISSARDITERKKIEDELDKHRKYLEDIVKERTKTLEEQNEKLAKFNKLFVDRELRIKELKDRIKELENRS